MPQSQSQVDVVNATYQADIRTRNGEGPHEVEGLMPWSVLNNNITDCWAIPADQTSGLAFLTFRTRLTQPRCAATARR